VRDINSPFVVGPVGALVWGRGGDSARHPEGVRAGQHEPLTSGAWENDDFQIAANARWCWLPGLRWCRRDARVRAEGSVEARAAGARRTPARSRSPRRGRKALRRRFYPPHARWPSKPPRTSSASRQLKTWPVNWLTGRRGKRTRGDGGRPKRIRQAVKGWRGMAICSPRSDAVKKSRGAIKTRRQWNRGCR